MLGSGDVQTFDFAALLEAMLADPTLADIPVAIVSPPARAAS